MSGKDNKNESEMHKQASKQDEAPRKVKEEVGTVDPQTKEKIEELKILSQELLEEKKKASEYYEQLVALKAEFENYRKRMEKEMGKLIIEERKQILRELLPVMDSSLMAKESLKKKEANVKEAVELIFREIRKIFEKFNVKKMDCEGKEFSPVFHHAVLKEKTEKVKPGHIVKVISNGYFFEDEVLKPATVVVAEKENKK